MSSTFDANVLLYASDQTSPYHPRAHAFLDQVAAGDELVYLFWPTVMAYLRIATHPAVFENPLPPADVLANVEQLLALPHVQTAGEHERFWPAYRRAAEDAGARGNLVPDAHLVALMHENGVRTIWTHDRDYRRFRGIEARDPFASAGYLHDRRRLAAGSGGHSARRKGATATLRLGELVARAAALEHSSATSGSTRTSTSPTGRSTMASLYRNEVVFDWLDDTLGPEA